MIERVITDNAGEKITIKWDGTRFALVQQENNYELPGVAPRQVIVLNPKEMLDLIEFAGTLGGE